MRPVDHKSLLIGALVAATVSATIPGFLVGALSIQISEEFGVSPAVYGWALGSFFLAGTAGSVVLGRLVQQIGPRRQISVSLAIAAAVQLALAGLARSFAAVIALLVVAGLVNSATQTAVNLALTRAEIHRLGLAMAIKQSGMPTSSLLSGLAVPVIALTLGWRWAYVAGAGVAMSALAAVRATVPGSEPVVARSAREPSSRRPLVWAAISCGFLAFSAGSLIAWIVGSGVDAGLSPGVAGLMQSLGAATGIAMRLMGGYQSDSMRWPPFRVAGLTALIGSVAMALLSVRSAGVHVLATLVAFGAGWIWPVFTNFGIVRADPAAAGSSTGVSQMGVYVGVFVAPLLTGVLITEYGYGPMWFVVAVAAVVGASIALLIADEF